MIIILTVGILLDILGHSTVLPELEDVLSLDSCTLVPYPALLGSLGSLDCTHLIVGASHFGPFVGNPSIFLVVELLGLVEVAELGFLVGSGTKGSCGILGRVMVFRGLVEVEVQEWGQGLLWEHQRN